MLLFFSSLNWFKPHVWQQQVFADRNPTLAQCLSRYSSS